MFCIHTRRLALGAATALAATTLAATACGGGGASSAASTSPSTVPAPRRDRAIISAGELTETQATNLFEVVQRLHPEWLTQRTVGSMSGAGAPTVQVYLDTQRAGGPEILKQMAVNSASSLHYYSASESQARFGNGNVNGVIQIQMVKRP